MRLIIDGYNLIFVKQHPPYSPKALERARAEFLAMLDRYNTKRKYHITVVFDGEGGIGQKVTQRLSNHIEVVFSSADSDADTVIKNLVEKAGRPRSVRVVTSDRELSRGVKRTGVQVMKSGEFLGELNQTVKASDKKETEPEEPSEKLHGIQDETKVKAWMELFGFEEE